MSEFSFTAVSLYEKRNANANSSIALDKTRIPERYMVAPLWVDCARTVLIVHGTRSKSRESLVRPHVKFANSVWCPFKLGNIEEIKKNFKKDK